MLLGRFRPPRPASPDAPGLRAPSDPMKLRIRKSSTKRAKKNGYRTRQKSVGGRKVNKRQRKRHGAF